MDDYGHEWTPSSDSDEGNLTDSPQQDLGGGLADHRQRAKNQTESRQQNRRQRTYSDAFSCDQGAKGALRRVLPGPFDARRELTKSNALNNIEHLKRNLSAALSTLSFAAAMQPLPFPTAAMRQPCRHAWWIQEQASAVDDATTTLSDPRDRRAALLATACECRRTGAALLATACECIMVMHRNGLRSCEIAARLSVPQNTVAMRLKLAGGSGSASSSGKTSGWRQRCCSLLLDRVALASACLVSAVVVTEPFAPYRIVHVNPAWVILCGYTAEEAIGETCAILQGPLTNRDDTRRFTRAVESSGLPASMVVLNYTKKGELFSNSIVSLPLRAGDTAAVAYHATVLSRIPD